MQQTLLALGALLIIMTVALFHQRSTFLMQEQVYLREIAHARDDLAFKLLEGIINQKEFDEWAIGRSNLPSDATPLTESAAFGPDPGEVNELDFDDVDDYHNFQDTVAHVISSDTFRFGVSYTVQYLTPSHTASPVKSFIKELTASLVSLDAIGGRVVTGRVSKSTIISDNL